MTIMLVRLLFRLAFFLFLARALVSWFRPARFNRTFYEVERLLFKLTEPVLRPIRNALPPFGGMDWSPVLAVILLSLIERLVLGFLR